MTLRSMTGFGRGRAVGGGLCVEVELSSVNRRQFEARWTLPRALLAHEPRLHALVHQAVERGSVTGTVRVNLSGAAQRRALGWNAELAAAYVRTLRGAARALGLRDDLTARTLAALPDLLRREDATENAEAVWPVLERAVRLALARLTAMRRAEGRRLAADLARRLDKLQAYRRHIARLAPRVARRYAELLRQRLEAAGLKLGADDPALARELALFADRCDIAEELVRLDSHFQEAARLLSARKPAGRPLDFLCQELFREINTIGSKANDAAISRLVVHFKTELECLREQVQNVE